MAEDLVERLLAAAVEADDRPVEEIEGLLREAAHVIELLQKEMAAWAPIVAAAARTKA